jgi:hypothetical protein
LSEEENSCTTSKASIKKLIDSHPSQIAKLSIKLNNIFCLRVSGGFGHFEDDEGNQTVTITGIKQVWHFKYIFRLFTDITTGCT